MEASDSGTDDETWPKGAHVDTATAISPPDINTASGTMRRPEDDDMSDYSSMPGNQVSSGADVQPGSDVIPGSYVMPGSDVTPGSDVMSGSDVIPGSDVTSGSDVIPGSDVTSGGDAMRGGPDFHPPNHEIVPLDDEDDVYNNDSSSPSDSRTLDIGHRDFDEGRWIAAMDQNKAGLTLKGQVNFGGDMTVNDHKYFDHRVKNKVTHHHHGDVHQTVVNKNIVKGAVFTQEAGFSQIVDQSKTEMARDQNVFVETRVYKEALELLDTKGIIVLSGPQGSGKSCLGHALLRHYSGCGYTPLVLHHFQEWRQHVGGDRRLVVLLEHLFGRDELSESGCHDLPAAVHTMEEFARGEKCRVVITTNDSVLDSLLESENSGSLSRYVFHLEQSSLLSDEEKRAMLQKHLAQVGRSISVSDMEHILASDKSGVHFALHCRQFAAKDENMPDRMNIFLAETVPLSNMCGSGPKTVIHISPEMMLNILEKSDRGYVQYIDVSVYQLVSSIMSAQQTVESSHHDEHPRLLQACYDGDAECVGRLLKGGEDADLRMAQGNISLLHVASYRGHVAVVELLLQNGADHTAADDAGWTSLHYACEQGHVRVVHRLIQHSCPAPKRTLLYMNCVQGHGNLVSRLLQCRLNRVQQHGRITLCSTCYKRHKKMIENICGHREYVNLSTESGLTSLYLASQNGHLDVVRLLLESGACPQVKFAQNGWTPLYVVCYLGHSVLAETLLEFGQGNFSEFDKYGMTLLHLACLHGRTEIVRKLIDSGANVDVQDHEGNTALHITCREGHLDTLDVLLGAGGNAVSSNKQEVTPLHMAITHKQSEVVKWLLEAGVPIQTDGKSTTSLSLACNSKCGDVGIVRMLLEHGAPADAAEASGMTPLWLAVENKQPEIVDVLCEHGAAPDIVWKRRGWSQPGTPLFAACQDQQFEMVQSLLKHGADPSVKCDQGMNALHVVAKAGSAGLVKMFVEAGCSINEKCNHGETALSLAFSNGHWEVVSVLAEYGADVHSLLHQACAWNSCEVIQVLIQCGAHIDFRNSTGATPLHMACGQGQLNIAKLLLENGANVNASVSAGKGTSVVEPSCSSLTGDTPLEIACYRCRYGQDYWELPLLLVEYGADVNPASLLKPLHIACSARQTRVVEIFLEKGADIEARDENGFTALHHAAQHAVAQSSLDTLELLLKNKADVDAKNNDGRTPLLLVCNHTIFSPFSNKIVCKLLEHGASVDAVDGNGCWSVKCLFDRQSCSVEGMLEVLIMHLAKKKLSSPCGSHDSALHLACQFPVAGWYKDLLKKRDWKVPLHRLCKSFLDGQLRFVGNLLEEDSSLVHALNDLKRTPLHMAAQYSGPDCVKCLIKHGAEVNAKDINGNSPLHDACRRPVFPCMETVRTLLEYGADPYSVNRDDYTPLHFISAVRKDRIFSDRLHELTQVVQAVSMNRFPQRRPCRPYVLPMFDQSNSFYHHPAEVFMDMAKVLLDRVDYSSIIRASTVDCLQIALTENWNEELIALLRKHERQWKEQSSKSSTGKNAECDPKPAVEGQSSEVTEEHVNESSVAGMSPVGLVPVSIQAGHHQVGSPELSVEQGAHFTGSLSCNLHDNEPIKGTAGQVRPLTELDTVAQCGATLSHPSDHEISSVHQSGSQVYGAACAGHMPGTSCSIDLGTRTSVHGPESAVSESEKGHKEFAVSSSKPGTENGQSTPPKPSSTDMFGIEPFSADQRTDSGSGVKLETDQSAENISATSSPASESGVTHVTDISPQSVRQAPLQLSAEEKACPLMEAAYNGDVDLITKLLQDGFVADTLGSHGHTALHLASALGHVSVVEVLLDHGANVSAMSSMTETHQDGPHSGEALLETPLQGAGEFPLVHSLKSLGTKHGLSCSKQTALHYACMGGHLEVVDVLVKHGAKLQAVDDLGRTPLHWAACMGHALVASLSVLLGADVNMPDKDGNLPLHLAAQGGLTDVCIVLLNSGAEACCKNKWCKTALSLAATNGHGHIVHVLERHYPQKDSFRELNWNYSLFIAVTGAVFAVLACYFVSMFT